jgi:hypothetical protein
MVSTAVADQALHVDIRLFSVAAPAIAFSMPVLPETSFREVALCIASPPRLESLSSVVLRI